MARVRSISNHSYCGRMRPKGSEYDVAEADVDILLAHSRVVLVPAEPPPNDRQTYSTRELQAAAPSSASVRSRRRVIPSDRQIVDDLAHSSAADES
jgi:hypothetical protein